MIRLAIFYLFLWILYFMFNSSFLIEKRITWNASKNERGALFNIYYNQDNTNLKNQENKTRHGHIEIYHMLII